MSKPDAREFRSALGKFATGVTIVTTSAEDGSPVGVTANSFNSVSLDPPMVLWSLSRASRSLAAFTQGGEFAVHVLSAHQEDLSARFASKTEDKFGGIAFERSPGGAPLLPGCVARFCCSTAYQYEAGDHIIFVGEVKDYEHDAGPPLLFHGGRYVEARERHGVSDVSGIDLETGRVTEDFLLLLLARAHHQASRPVTQAMAEAGMNEAEHLTLALLSINGALTLQALRARLEVTGNAPTAETIAGLRQRGWAKDAPDGAPIELTDKGRERFLFVLARTKAQDDEVLSHFSPAEMAEGRRFLRKIIEVTSDGVPPLWE